MKEASIHSALFGWRGNHIAGDEIEVVLLKDSEKDETWWYRVVPMEGYVYLRLPVNVGAVVEVVGHAKRDVESSDDLFRFVPAPTGRVRTDSAKNTRMPFMVFGYQPLLLLDMLKATPA